MVGWVLLFFSIIAFTGCAGADDVSQGGSGGGGDDDRPGYGLPPGDNDSDLDDGSGWPRWKNPCPGPACDPPRGAHPEWVVDPPPEHQLAPVQEQKN